MEWSPQQEAALKAVQDWLDNGEEQVFRLFGFAGTGKTTLAKHLAEGVKGTVLFGAFTGKASKVLQEKGCPATTIHQMIYRSKQPSTTKVKEMEAELAKLLLIEEPTDIQKKKIADYRKELEIERTNAARPMFDLNRESEVRGAALVVIDECSMVDGVMGQDLLSFGVKVLVLGDPAQLPPVGGAGFFTDHKPDFLLDEIHRQAEGDPILDLATLTRNKKLLDLGDCGTSRVIDLDETKPDDLKKVVMEADQIIVGRNNTRHSYNRRMRKLHDRTSQFPEAGDKVVCRRNDHDTGLMNGAIFYVEDVGEVDENFVVMTIRPDTGGDPIHVIAHSAFFLGETVPWWEMDGAQHFEYAYAVTCHTAQGSQWDNVVVFDESYCFKKDRHRWLYTAITRAAKSVTVVKT